MSDPVELRLELARAMRAGDLDLAQDILRRLDVAEREQDAELEPELHAGCDCREGAVVKIGGAS